jgi:DnaJ like chaperone protein
MSPYRRHQSPGCGGLFIIIAMLLLLSGGAPLLFNVVGVVLMSLFIFFVMIAGGLWAFSLFIRHKVSQYESQQSEDRNQFVSLLIHILVKIAELDGQVSRDEIATITNFFRTNLHYSQEQMLWVKEFIKDASGSPATLDELLAEFKDQFGYQPRLILVELVFQVLYSNHQVSSSELELTQRIASFLGISQFEYVAIRGRYHAHYESRTRQQRSDTSRYYEILGLAPGASAEEIKNAYRKLSKEYHPDLVAHLGDEFRKVAEEKMKEINMAYQHLKNGA